MQKLLFVTAIAAGVAAAPSFSDAALMHRFIEGSLFYAGNNVGSYTADVHYNPNPSAVKADPIEPGFVVHYTPVVAAAAEFYIDFTFNMFGSPFCFGGKGCTITYGPATITDFYVNNNNQFLSPGLSQDQFVIEASYVNGSNSGFTFSFRDQDGSSLSSTALEPILLGEEDAIFAPHQFPGGNQLLATNIAGVSVFGGVSSVGAVPEPGTLSILTTGLLALGASAIRRRSMANR